MINPHDKLANQIKNKKLQKALRDIQNNKITEEELFEIVFKLDADAHDFKVFALSLICGLDVVVTTARDLAAKVHALTCPHNEHTH